MSRIAREIKHFSDLGHIWWGALTPAGQRRYDIKFKRFKKLCTPKKGDKILEIGCGDGEFTKRLVSLDAQIVGTDVTPALIKKAQKTFVKKGIKFFVDDAEKMEIKNESFNVVCGISILHHIDLEKSLKECFRVLKKGGKLFFTEPNLLNPQIFVSLNIPWVRKKLEYSPDEVALVRWEVERLLRKIGFSEARVMNFDFLYPLTPKWAIFTAEKISEALEKTPLLREISGSLIVFAKK